MLLCLSNAKQPAGSSKLLKKYIINLKLQITYGNKKLNTILNLIISS